MIKFLASSEGRPMIGLGLSRGNCEKLLQGKPIFIDLKVMAYQTEGSPLDTNEATILIFGGESEDEMQREMRRHGIKLPKSKVHSEEN